MVEIQLVSSRSARRAFIGLPYALYREHPHWVPPLRRAERERFLAAQNPFYDHADMHLFLARQNGALVGRIAAIDDRLHHDVHRDGAAFFGFFEATDAGVAAALLDAAESFARARGRTAVRGPINPSLNESAGLLVDGFDESPCLLMPYNPPIYATFVERAGYRKTKDLYAWLLDTSGNAGPRAIRLAGRARRRRGVVVKAVGRGAINQALPTLHDIYRRAWRDNWGFVPPTPRETDHFSRQLRWILDPEIALWAEVDGTPAACAVAVPDFNQVLKGTTGRLGPRLLSRLLRTRRLVLLGVLPEYRHIGLIPLLLDELFRHDTRRQYRRAELSWVLEDNDQVNKLAAAMGAVHYKTYRLYQKELA